MPLISTDIEGGERTSKRSTVTHDYSSSTKSNSHPHDVFQLEFAYDLVTHNLLLSSNRATLFQQSGFIFWLATHFVLLYVTLCSTSPPLSLHADQPP
jgi:hypothetical protein